MRPSLAVFAKMALRVLAASRLQISKFLPAISSQSCKMSNGGEWGSGTGKGGGSGGSIRDAGGSFGKRESAQEEEYFRRVQREQVSKLKAELDTEIKYHEDQMKHHVEAIERHKQRVTEISKAEGETSK